MWNNMVLTEIALLKWQTNMRLVSEDCWFAVQLSRRILGQTRIYLKEILLKLHRPASKWFSIFLGSTWCCKDPKSTS